MAYSGNQQGYNSRSQGGSAHSTDLLLRGDTDSCGWEGGRWCEWKLDHIHTFDNPDSWKSLSSPPMWQENVIYS